MFIKDNLRFNIYASKEIAGIRYPNFLNPDLRAQLGIEEISDPTPPEDYTDETYFRTEQDDAPYIVYTKKSPEQLEELRLSKIPKSVTMRQARLQLLSDGVLETIDAAVQNIGPAAKIEWEYASEIERTNPLVDAMKVILSWDDSSVEQFFIEASKL